MYIYFYLLVSDWGLLAIFLVVFSNAGGGWLLLLEEKSELCFQIWRENPS